ncbi:MAG: topoisomerase-4 subunit A [Paraglaciecola sp.]|jgi:topoisomerase-4 subunit A
MLPGVGLIFLPLLRFKNISWKIYMDDSKKIAAEKEASSKDKGKNGGKVISLSGMYQDYFLDYASYVILERAVPSIEDGLKPVQRRILYSLKEKDDGRYHKVANIIGHTMQYHPHGDAAIGGALVGLGQKDLLIDCQGNWGDVRTGDSAAAPRYIEARLTKFALEVGFNGQTTEWQVSYDGRNKEPMNLPMKFPLLLAQGVEGIAVGLSTKMMPHNFIELIKASIKILEDKPFIIYPDFQTGGMVDVTEYNKGKRGGKVKVRARIEKLDKNTLIIKELPYAVTTTTLMDSIVRANDKGKIKIKKVTDNTAADVEILVDVAPGVSPDVTMDALYAFTDCEVSISPNACVIIENKPHFLTVDEILVTCTENTKLLLKWELEIKKGELEERWHMASLEKIFITNRVYREIEECETWEEVIETIDKELKKYVGTPGDPVTKGDRRLQLMRNITEDDIGRLTEIKIKRISKYNSFKADEKILEIEETLKEVMHHLAHLTAYSIAYFENLLTKYGKGKERRTEITSFETIKVTAVAANNAKLYVNLKEGFVGTNMKKDEFVCDCSDIDDVIVFLKDGKFKVVRVSDKVFVGPNILHVAVWRKGDERTTYNMMYLDGKTGRTMAKRFNVKAITRDKDYDLTKGTKNSKCSYFTANPNGEAEVISVQLSQGSGAKKKIFDYNFGELAIKGRGSQGNIVTRYPIRKVTQIEVGKSTLGAIKIYMDDVSGRLNTENRGTFLGAFDTGAQILVIYKDGSYELTDYELTNRYEVKNIEFIRKLDPKIVISALYHDGNKGWTMVKRFQIDTKVQNQKYPFITEHRSSKLYYVTTEETAKVKYAYRTKEGKIEEDLDLVGFIDVKGWKALGNKLSENKIISIKEIVDEKKVAAAKEKAKVDAEEAEKLKAEDTIDLDLNQGKLF